MLGVQLLIFNKYRNPLQDSQRQLPRALGEGFPALQWFFFEQQSFSLKPDIQGIENLGAAVKTKTLGNVDPSFIHFHVERNNKYHYWNQNLL